MSQLNHILLSWCDPRTATESNPESRAKPGGWRVTVSRGREGQYYRSYCVATPTSRSLSSRQRKVTASILRACHCLGGPGETQSLVNLIFGNSQK